MENVERRQKIMDTLRGASKAVSAAYLAERNGVSRQVIVGDIALLRAEGESIVATARGYMLERVRGTDFRGRIPCIHKGLEDTEKELRKIVQLGGRIIDVIVDHPFYGEISGQLNLFDEDEISEFIEYQRGLTNGLLSDLTGGIHLHTISCKNKIVFDRIKEALDELGFLVK
jgi:transcriptional regulator of NAD metabolism